MLAANVCAAGFLIENEHPALYRIHAGPSEEKLDGLRAMLKDFALQLPGGKQPKPADYSALLAKIKERPDAPLLQTVLLRSMKQAVYSPDNIGHFGLSYDAYTHFTSPIRRYPDLLTHRAIKAVLKGGTYDPKQPWDQLGMQCSATERRADEATRDVTAWLKCYYMKDRLGEEFAGTISGVTNFGIFVTLDDVYVEGLVHISELGQDYFHFDQAKHQIVGERTNKKFQLADRVNIKVARVDIESSKIDFVLTGERLKKALPVDAAAPVSPWAKPAAGALEKGKGRKGEPEKVARQKDSQARAVKPSPVPQAVVEPARKAKVEKTIVTFDSSNPPTTPLAGFDPAARDKQKVKTPVREKAAPADKPAAKGRNPGALLSRKKK